MDTEVDHSPEAEKAEDASLNRKLKLRHANVYDAVAGRISSETSRNKSSLLTNDYSGISSTRIFPAVPPEEVLFRRQNAPVRYMEDDFYFANEEIPEDQPLPDSDLLKAIHTYASDLYSNTMADRGRSAWRTMDETALIALGFLLEEAAVEALEETGDLVLVEGEPISDSESVGRVSRGRSRQTSVSALSTQSRVDGYSSGGGLEDGMSSQRRKRKRRRLNSLSTRRSVSERSVP